jgi:LEA14-like dessication related protein
MDDARQGSACPRTGHLEPPDAQQPLRPAPQADGGCPPTTIRLSRRAALLGALPLAACASLGGREPLTVDVVGVEPLAGQGMEGRFLVKLRLQNPGETPVDFDGVSVSLDVRGSRLASGVGDVRGTVPRFGETVIAVPVTVPVSAMIRQALGFASGDRARLDIRPEAMGITWHDVEAMLRGLPGGSCARRGSGTRWRTS